MLEKNVFNFVFRSQFQLCNFSSIFRIQTWLDLPNYKIVSWDFDPRCTVKKLIFGDLLLMLKRVFAKNERGYRRNVKNKHFWSLLILLLSVASIRRKMLKTTHTEELSVHTNSESCKFFRMQSKISSNQHRIFSR